MSAGPALDGITVLAKPNTCLDPRLYDMAVDGAEVVPFEDKLKFMAPAVLTGMAEATILDVPDALVALRRFPGRIKVLGEGDIDRALTVRAHAFSLGAVEKIKAAGGTVEVVED